MRLDALQARVELLGTEGSRPPAPPPPPQPPIVSYPEPEYEPPPESYPTYEPEPVADYGAPEFGPGPGHEQQPRPWSEDAYALGLGQSTHAPYHFPPQPPLDYAPTTDPYPQPAQAVLGAAGAVEFLDVGPFSGLVELREFEDAIAAIESVRDVRVRRFGHRRAQLDVWTAGPNALSRELWRLGRPLSFKPGFEGQLIIEFAPRSGGQRPAAAGLEPRAVAPRIGGSR